jgi:hypothetical protein
MTSTIIIDIFEIRSSRVVHHLFDMIIGLIIQGIIICGDDEMILRIIIGD